MATGTELANVESKKRLAITQTHVATTQDLGTIVPAGRTVLVTALSLGSSVANTFRLQNGGGTSPGDNRFVFNLPAVAQASLSFEHPLVLNGLAGEFTSAGTLSASIAYRVL